LAQVKFVQDFKHGWCRSGVCAIMAVPAVVTRCTQRMPNIEASRRGLTASFLIMLIVNTLSQAQGPGFKQTNQALSFKNPTSVTPDPMTFMIWPLIFLMEAMITAQEWRARGPFNSIEARRRACLCLAFLSNALWQVAFTNEWYVASALVMLLYLAALARAYVDLDFKPGTANSFVLRAGVAVNFAWICVATCINVLLTVERVRLGLKPGETFEQPAGSEAITSVVSVLLAAIAAAAAYRLDGAFPAAAAWALLGVRRAQVALSSRYAATFAGICAAACAVEAVAAVVVYKKKAKLRY